MKIKTIGQLGLLVLWGIRGIADAQTSYGRYDVMTTDYENRLANSQIQANSRHIAVLKQQQNTTSLFSSEGSIQRSRIQALINAMENENFRLNQKSFALKDSKVIRDKERLNAYRKQYPLYKVSLNPASGVGSYRLSKSAEDFNQAVGQPIYAEDLK